MCKKGDIILVKSYKHASVVLPQHSFVVIEDRNGEINGMNYDFIALVMSSVKSSEQIKRKLRYPGNIFISSTERVITTASGGNRKNGYVKCDQFYFFVRENLSYSVIGSFTERAMNKIIQKVNTLISNGIQIEAITDNLVI